MELTFTKDGNAYVAEFEVTSEFNLHLEKKKPGKIELYQRTVNGKFAHVEDFDNENKFQNVFDFDSGVIAVTPKTIKIVSEVEPTYAAVTTSGEVTEIKSQSKEVEVTANGTMDITPDAGFAYLNSVKVKTNVAGSGEGSASSWRYFDISKIDNSMKPMAFPFIVKIPSDNRIVPASAIGDWTNITAFGVDDSPKLYTTKTGLDSWSQMMAVEGLTPEVMAQVGFVEITEEEFYNLNA